MDQSLDNKDEGVFQIQITNFDISKVDIYRGDVSQYNSTYTGQVDKSAAQDPSDDDDDDFDEDDDDQQKN